MTDDDFSELEDFDDLAQDYHELQAVADGHFQNDLLDQLMNYDELFMSAKDLRFARLPRGGRQTSLVLPGSLSLG